jgi:hypothetical protein
MTDKQERIYGVSWLHLLAYSIVALCALLQVVDKVSDTSSEIQWSVSALSISVAFSGLAVIASLLMKEKFIGTAIEGGLVRSLSRVAMICSLARDAIRPFVIPRGRARTTTVD